MPRRIALCLGVAGLIWAAAPFPAAAQGELGLDGGAQS